MLAAAAAIATVIGGAAAEAVAIAGNDGGGVVRGGGGGAEFVVGAGGLGADDAAGGAAALFDNGLVTRCFGSSHAATALRASWQQQLQRVVAELGTQYVRFHGLLDDDMSVVIWNGFSSSSSSSSAEEGHGDESLAAVVGVATTGVSGNRTTQSPRSKWAAGDGDAGDNQTNCTFVVDQDFADQGGGVFNATSQEECCQLCYTASTGLPAPCIAAVWTPWGQCYLKLNSAQPLSKPGSGLQACITNREPPNAFA